MNEFTANQLASSGSPTPANTIAGSNTTLNLLTGLTLDEAPVVTSVTPAAGTSGATVTINGAGFLYGSSVNFGSTPATSVTYISPYELQANAPPGGGTVDVTVSTGAGTSATSSADQFTYTNSGYVVVASDGGVFNYGSPFYGSQGGKALNAPIVGIAGDPATGGYWEVAADGGVFSFNAPLRGVHGRQAPQRAHRRHRGHGRRWRLLAGRQGRRCLQLRRRQVLRQPGRPSAQRPGRGHRGRQRRRVATGRWPPTGASSTTTPPSSAAGAARR